MVHSQSDTVSAFHDTDVIVRQIAASGGNVELVTVPDKMSDSDPGKARNGHRYFAYTLLRETSQAVLYDRLNILAESPGRRAGLACDALPPPTFGAPGDTWLTKVPKPPPSLSLRNQPDPQPAQKRPRIGYTPWSPPQLPQGEVDIQLRGKQCEEPPPTDDEIRDASQAACDSNYPVQAIPAPLVVGWCSRNGKKQKKHKAWIFCTEHKSWGGYISRDGDHSLEDRTGRCPHIAFHKEDILSAMEVTSDSWSIQRKDANW